MPHPEGKRAWMADSAMVRKDRRLLMEPNSWLHQKDALLGGLRVFVVNPLMKGVPYDSFSKADNDFPAGGTCPGGMHEHAGLGGKGDEVPRMAKEELGSRMGQPDLIVLDVRVGDEWKGSKEKIKGTIRENPEAGVKPWAEKYPKDKTTVTYCT